MCFRRAVTRISGDAVCFVPSDVNWDPADLDTSNGCVYLPLALRPRLEGLPCPSLPLTALREGVSLTGGLGEAWDATSAQDEAVPWDVRTIVSVLWCPTLPCVWRAWGVQVTEEQHGDERILVLYHRLGAGGRAGVVFGAYKGSRAFTLSDHNVSIPPSLLVAGCGLGGVAIVQLLANLAGRNIKIRLLLIVKPNAAIRRLQEKPLRPEHKCPPALPLLPLPSRTTRPWFRRVRNAILNLKYRRALTAPIDAWFRSLTRLSSLTQAQTTNTVLAKAAFPGATVPLVAKVPHSPHISPTPPPLHQLPPFVRSPGPRSPPS